VPHCPNCGNTIDADSIFCPFCGSAIQPSVAPEPQGVPSSYKHPPPAWGYAPERANMREILSASWKIITQRPILLIPHLISTIVSTMLGAGVALSLLGFFGGLDAELDPLMIVAVLVVFVISTFIEAIYPRLTKQVLDGEMVDLGGATSQALSRVIPILGTALMVFLITIAGGIPFILGVMMVFIAPENIALAPLSLVLIVVGGLLILYITIWYYCAVPALMLEDRGVFDALSTSKAFSSGKKWTIFGLMLFVSLVSSIVGVVVGLIPVIGIVLMFLVSLFITAYTSVIRSYLYIRFSGTYHVTPTSHRITPTTSEPASPPPEAKPFDTRFDTRCPTCGAEVGGDQTYCGWCGSKL